MRQDDFVNFMRATICKFEQGNSYGTAHIYKNSLSNLIAFYRTDRIPFKKITPELLKGFEFYLRQKQLSWNTVSTYLRTIRATYNRAVDRHLAPISRDYSNKYIQVHVQIGKRHWTPRKWRKYFRVGKTGIYRRHTLARTVCLSSCSYFVVYLSQTW